MFDNLFEKIDKFWIKIPALLYILGFFVHNAYLASYSIFEFDLLQVKYVYSGATTLFFLLIVFYFVVAKLDFENLSNNLKFLNLTYWITRILMVCVVCYFMIEGKFNLVPESLYHIIRKDIAFRISNVVILSSVWYVLIIFFTRTGESKTFKIIMIIFGFFLAFLLIYISFYNDLLRHIIFITLFLFAQIFYVFWFQLQEEKDPEKLATHPFIVRSNIQRFASFVIILYGVLTTLSYYSTSIYPRIQSAFGGGKPIQSRVLLQNDTLDVDIVSESSSWLIYREKDSSDVTKLKTNEVKSIVYIQEKKKTEAPDSTASVADSAAIKD